jgi:tryptophan synthase alpha chain
MKPGAAGPPWTARFCVLSRARIHEYARSLRPCLALAQNTPAATHHSEMGSKRLAVYLMAFPETPELAERAVAGGADLVELGFPFSDPLADGPVIRLAGERALARGMRTKACLECLAETRSRVGPDVPLVPMTYASILEAYGYVRFWEEARAAGATTLIVADLPIEAAPEIPRVQLVAPTSSSERIRLAAARTDGWLYVVSLTGTTGARTSVSNQLEGLVRRARAVTDMPLLAGFGISTPEQAAAGAALADGVVVGSRAIQVADESGAAGLERFVASLRRAVDSVPASVA